MTARSRLFPALGALLLAGLATLAALASPVVADTSRERVIAELSREIGEREARAGRLLDAADTLGVSANFFGNSIAAVGSVEHQCSILGRLLGFEEEVQPLTDFEDLTLDAGLTEQTAPSAIIEAVSLDNWTQIADHMLKRSPADWAQLWNMKCPGRHGIPQDALATLDGSPASIWVEDSYVYVLGDIEEGLYNELARAIAENDGITTVALGSRGGNVVEALRAGELIRLLGLNTVLYSDCYSACPLVFLGGVHRMINNPHPALGMHQPYDASGRAIAPGHELYGALRDYIARMGADPRFMLAAMLAASPDRMHKPELDRLCDVGVATWIKYVCNQ